MNTNPSHYQLRRNLKVTVLKMAKSKASMRKTNGGNGPMYRPADVSEERALDEPDAHRTYSLVFTSKRPPSLLSFPSMPPTSTTSLPRNLFVASLGNPSPYQNTLHSAGHLVLVALQSYLHYPIFQRSSAHASGYVSRGQDALLWQSPTLMNTSGPTLAKAWRTFLKDLDGQDARKRARLVVVHDELEMGLGQVKVKKPGASLKGHNGLKSIASTAAGVGPDGGMAQLWRIGVGIGRPSSREKEDVSRHVLRNMTPDEREAIEATAEIVADQLAILRDE